MFRPDFPRLSHAGLAHAAPSTGFMAKVYRGAGKLTDQQRAEQAPGVSPNGRMTAASTLPTRATERPPATATGVHRLRQEGTVERGVRSRAILGPRSEGRSCRKGLFLTLSRSRLASQREILDNPHWT